MRYWLLLVVMVASAEASATTWIMRSWEGLLRDADAVVVGEVGAVTRATAEFRVERVLSGAPGRVIVLPVVRCNEPGPDGAVYALSSCLERTYQAGERLLLLLADDGRGLRELGYPSLTRFSLPSDAEDRARRLLALSTTDPAARARGLAEMLHDPRADWQRDAAEAAHPNLTAPRLAHVGSARVHNRAVDLLTEPLLRVLTRGATPGARAAAAGALGAQTVESLLVTQALLAAAAGPDPVPASSAAQALGARADPRGADALLALALGADDPDLRRSLLYALTPVVRTDHADALARVFRRSSADESDAVLEVWVRTGDPRAADQAAQVVQDGDPWRFDWAMRTLGQSRDRRYADLALDRLRPVVCDEAEWPRSALLAAPLLAPAERAVPAVAAYFACGSPYIRWQAVQALGQIDLPIARAALVAQRRAEADPEARQALDQLLGTLQPDER